MKFTVMLTTLLSLAHAQSPPQPFQKSYRCAQVVRASDQKPQPSQALVVVTNTTASVSIDGAPNLNFVYDAHNFEGDIRYKGKGQPRVLIMNRLSPAVMSLGADLAFTGCKEVL